MSGISTHVLDTSRGVPAAGVPVTLHQSGDGGRWVLVSSHKTDAEGRVRSVLPPAGALSAGVFRLRFDVAADFGAGAIQSFFPFVEIVFEVTEPSRHHHVPLLISPFGYSTYRGT
jgi:5-hydroxyisourate hydrolase